VSADKNLLLDLEMNETPDRKKNRYNFSTLGTKSSTKSSLDGAIFKKTIHIQLKMTRKNCYFCL
jgi:hypothetical protein